MKKLFIIITIAAHFSTIKPDITSIIKGWFGYGTPEPRSTLIIEALTKDDTSIEKFLTLILSNKELNRAINIKNPDIEKISKEFEKTMSNLDSLQSKFISNPTEDNILKQSDKFIILIGCITLIAVYTLLTGMQNIDMPSLKKVLIYFSKTLGGGEIEKKYNKFLSQVKELKTKNPELLKIDLIGDAGVFDIFFANESSKTLD